MSTATVRELREQGDRVLDRVARGETVTITRDGTPVARLTPLRLTPLSATALHARFSRLPSVDPARWRADVDAVVDPAL